MKLLDANIVIYSIGRDHPYKAACLEIMEQVGRESSDYVIDAELLQEILHVFQARGQVAKGINKVNDLLEMFPDLILIGAAEIRAASRILAQYPCLSARDAIHVAVVQTHGLEGLVSTDRAFEDIAGLARYDPVALFSDRD